MCEMERALLQLTGRDYNHLVPTPFRFSVVPYAVNPANQTVSCHVKCHIIRHVR
jgi:hypothetical protein